MFLLKRKCKKNSGPVNIWALYFSDPVLFVEPKKKVLEIMYDVIRKIRQFNLPVKIKLELFDKIVLRIILLIRSVWIRHLQTIERIFFLIFEAYFSSEKFHSVSYGKTGRYPLYINVLTRMVSYWTKLRSAHEDKIVNVLYNYLYTLFIMWNVKNPWFECIWNILTCVDYNIFINKKMKMKFG